MKISVMATIDKKKNEIHINTHASSESHTKQLPSY